MYKRPLTDPQCSIEPVQSDSISVQQYHSSGSLSVDSQPYHCVASVLRTPVACAIWGSQLSSSVFVCTTGFPSGVRIEGSISSPTFKPLNLISAFTHLLARRDPQRTSAPAPAHNSLESQQQAQRTSTCAHCLRRLRVNLPQ